VLSAVGSRRSRVVATVIVIVIVLRACWRRAPLQHRVRHVRVLREALRIIDARKLVRALVRVADSVRRDGAVLAALQGNRRRVALMVGLRRDGAGVVGGRAGGESWIVHTEAADCPLLAGEVSRRRGSHLPAPGSPASWDFRHHVHGIDDGNASGGRVDERTGGHGCSRSSLWQR